MENVLLRALSFILIIAAGYLFKVCGIFKEGDHRLVSKIVMNLTLPCALIYSFSSAEQDSSMLFAVVLGLLCATLPMLFAFFATASKPTGIRAFAMLNGGGYNKMCIRDSRIPVHSSGWHRHCHHAAGFGLHDCGQGRQDGPDDGHSRPWSGGKHELF